MHKVLLAAATFVLAPAVASAAERASTEFCQSYARLAVNMYAEVATTPACHAIVIGDKKNGLRWSGRERDYIDWCGERSLHAVEKEVAATTKMVLKCRRIQRSSSTKKTGTRRKRAAKRKRRHSAPR